MSKVNALYHIVFATKNREKTITPDCCNDLYRYIWGILKNNNCVLYRIGGIPNHIHLLIDLSPNVALSSLIRDIKSSSSTWLSKNPQFDRFRGWGKEYFAATIAYKDKAEVISYIMSQPEHHKVKDFASEMDEICASENLIIGTSELC